MTGNEYQEVTLRAANTESQTQNNLLINSALGLYGESDEVADLMKRARFQGHSLDVDHLAGGLGDITWCLAVMASAIGKNSDDILASNVDKLRERYPKGFGCERSVHRPEYEGGARHD